MRVKISVAVIGVVVTEVRRNSLIKGPEALAALEEFLTTLHLSAMQPVRSATKDVSWLP